MKAAIVLALVLAAPLALGATGKVSDDYVRVSAEPDFQYRADQDVLVPMQFLAVRGSVPQQDLVAVSFWNEDKTQRITIPGGQDWLRGVRPYPDVVNVNFGKMDPGLYRVRIEADAGELHKTQLVEWSVVKPPYRYAATLQEKGGNEAEFFLQGHEPGAVFQVQVYRDGGGGRIVLATHTGNNVTAPVPYIPGEPVKVDVTGPNGWLNYENKQTDLLTGRTITSPWVHYPDYKLAQNFRDASFQQAVGAGVIFLVLIGAVLAAWRLQR